MKQIIIYTDGGCRGNGKNDKNIGAIGGILIYQAGQQKKEFKKAFPNTTNNQMELMAVITALQMLKEPCQVTIHSDSSYVVNAYKQHWVDGWKKKGWTRGKAGALKNKELWVTLDQLVQKNDVSFEKVKGHANDNLNNRADLLVNEAMDEWLEDQKRCIL
ncbi:MAG: ribonuclease HI [Eubacteriaceae bacterium]|nr:ribonuclease HI [Eubacteriaceae bacterium]